MFIPKGTIILPNLWHMNRDPEIFGKNTEHFEPARYLDASGDIAPGMSDIKEQGHFSYGLGRRICPGRHMADNTLFINFAVLLWASKFDRKKDASGHFVPLDLDGWTDVGLTMLADFITCRYVNANMGVSADVRSPSNLRSLHASQRLLPCLHRNVRCGGYEHEVTPGMHTWAKKVGSLSWPLGVL
jgi:hypothetical protein